MVSHTCLTYGNKKNMLNIRKTYVKLVFKYVYETYGVVFFIRFTYVKKRMLNICATYEKRMLHILLCILRMVLFVVNRDVYRFIRLFTECSTILFVSYGFYTIS